MLRCPRLYLAIAAFPLMYAGPAFALKSVTVMADSTMSIAIAQIGREYSREHEVTVSTSFVPPQAQQAQINEGAAADILITPQLPWIEQLKTQGLVDIYSQTEVAHDQLALVGPVDSPINAMLTRGFPLNALIQQLSYGAFFVVGNPEALAEGVYGKEALRNMDIADDLEPFTLYIKELGQMFDMVTKHGAYGLFFYSTLTGHDGLRVIDLLPESTHKPIVYYGVVIAGENMDEARNFMTYLKSDTARRILRENGFSLD